MTEDEKRCKRAELAITCLIIQCATLIFFGALMVMASVGEAAFNIQRYVIAWRLLGGG